MQKQANASVPKRTTNIPFVVLVGIITAGGLACGTKGNSQTTGTLGSISSYSATVTYQMGDVVFCAFQCSAAANGSSYVAIATSTGADPSNTTDWAVLAKAGATGPAGSAGPIGPAGPAGPAGPQGIHGLPGAAGAAGAQGPQGPAGPAGANGTIGAVAIWNKTVPYTVGQVVFCGTICQTNGSSYIALNATVAGDDPSQDAVNWQMIAQAGAVGPQGMQGIQGIQGATGAVGPQGPTGPQGLPGLTGSMGNQFIYTGMIANSVNPATPTASYFAAPTSSVLPASGIYSSVSQFAFTPAQATCTMRGLTVNAVTSTANGIIGTDTMTFTVFKNDVATSMSCSLQVFPFSTTASCSDTSDNFIVIQTDHISIQVTNTDAVGGAAYIAAGTILSCS